MVIINFNNIMEKDRPERTTKRIFLRSKVGKTHFNGEIPIIIPYVEYWKINLIFQTENKKNKKTECIIKFNSETYNAHTTYFQPTSKLRKTPEYRLYIDAKLKKELQVIYKNSYLKVTKYDKFPWGSQVHTKNGVVNLNPQFLDIEFEPTEKTFYFYAHFI